MSDEHAERRGYADPTVERFAGSDTREAAATPTVQRVLIASVFAFGPAWASIVGIAAAWSSRSGVGRDAGPWIVLGLATSAVAAGIFAWRRPVVPGPSLLPPGAGVAFASALAAFVVAGTGDDALGAVAGAALPACGGWTCGRAARLAVTAVVPSARSAAAGLTVAAAFGGLVLAVQLGGAGGVTGVAGWTSAYLVVSGISLLAARASLDADRRRGAARAAARREPADHVANRPLGVESVTVRFGERTVLDRVTLAVGERELVALVGGNGSGKSTLLRTVAGFVVPAEGRVLLAGDDVTALRPEERAAAGLAFVSGAHPVFPDLTVVENLRVAAFRTHLAPRAFASATEAVLDVVPALAGRRRDKAGVLSGGEQRMLAVAQALYRRPVVLLADELTLGLDLSSRLAVLDLLRLLADDGVCVVVVDHDLPSLLPRADRAVLLAGGGTEEFADPLAFLGKRADLLPATFLSGAGR